MSVRKLSEVEAAIWAQTYMEKLKDNSISEAIQAADKSIQRLRSFSNWSRYDIVTEDKYDCDVEW